MDQTIRPFGPDRTAPREQLPLYTIEMSLALPPLQPFVQNVLPKLAQRNATPDQGIYPHLLVFWVAGTASPRTAQLAPPIYLNTVLDEQTGVTETQAAVEGATASQSVNTQRWAKRRLRLASRGAVEQGGGKGPEQSCLSPMDLRVLAELVPMLRHQQWGVYCQEHPTRGDLIALEVSPIALLKRLGLERSGPNYDAVERVLAKLAMTRVVSEYRPNVEQDWKPDGVEALIQWVDTGKTAVNGGIKTERLQARHKRWIVSLGKPVMELLRCRTADLAVLSPGLWQAAGRSPASQWLALYLSGHGYNAGKIHPHQLETIVRRMRLLPDDVQRDLLQADTRRASLGTGEAHHAPRATAKQVNFSKLDNAMRLQIRRVDQASRRLVERGGIQCVETHASVAPHDIQPSKIGIQRSRSDRLTWRRWAASVELMASRIVRKAGLPIRELLSQASSVALKLEPTSWASQHRDPVHSLLRRLEESPTSPWIKGLCGWVFRQASVLLSSPPLIAFQPMDRPRERMPWVLAPS